MLPLPLTRRSSVTDGMTTTDSFSRLRRIASHRRQVALEAIEDLVSLLIVEVGQVHRLVPQRSCIDRAHGVIRAVSTPFTSNARTGLLKPASSRSPAGVLTTNSSTGEHPLGDEDLPRLRH